MLLFFDRNSDLNDAPQKMLLLKILEAYRSLCFYLKLLSRSRPIDSFLTEHKIII